VELISSGVWLLAGRRSWKLPTVELSKKTFYFVDRFAYARRFLASQFWGFRRVADMLAETVAHAHPRNGNRLSPRTHIPRKNGKIEERLKESPVPHTLVSGNRPRQGCTWVAWLAEYELERSGVLHVNFSRLREELSESKFTGVQVTQAL
jgi:hypothetical protein